MLNECNTPPLSGTLYSKSATRHQFWLKMVHLPSGSDGYIFGYLAPRGGPALSSCDGYSSYVWISGSRQGPAPSGSDRYSSYFELSGSDGCSIKLPLGTEHASLLGRWRTHSCSLMQMERYARLYVYLVTGVCDTHNHMNSDIKNHIKTILKVKYKPYQQSHQNQYENHIEIRI